MVPLDTQLLPLHTIWGMGRLMRQILSTHAHHAFTSPTMAHFPLAYTRYNVEQLVWNAIQRWLAGWTVLLLSTWYALPDGPRHSMNTIHNHRLSQSGRGHGGGSMERVNVFIQPLMAHMNVVIEHLKRAGATIHHLTTYPPQYQHPGESYILVPTPKAIDYPPDHSLSKDSLSKSSPWAFQVTVTFLDVRLTDRDVRPWHDPIFRPLPFDLPIPNFPSTTILGPPGPVTTAYRYFCVAARDGPQAYCHDIFFHTDHRPDYRTIDTVIVFPRLNGTFFDFGLDRFWSFPAAKDNTSTPFDTLRYLVDREVPPIFLGAPWLQQVAEGKQEVLVETGQFAFALPELRRRVYDHRDKVAASRQPPPVPPRIYRSQYCRPPHPFPSFAPGYPITARLPGIPSSDGVPGLEVESDKRKLDGQPEPDADWAGKRQRYMGGDQEAGPSRIYQEEQGDKRTGAQEEAEEGEIAEEPEREEQPAPVMAVPLSLRSPSVTEVGAPSQLWNYVELVLGVDIEMDKVAKTLLEVFDVTEYRFAQNPQSSFPDAVQGSRPSPILQVGTTVDRGISMVIRFIMQNIEGVANIDIRLPASLVSEKLEDAVAQGWDITNDPLEKRRPWHATPPKILALSISGASEWEDQVRTLCGRLDGGWPKVPAQVRWD
ncbi:uncharacterized protein MKK02DRAFT_29259 [Dioszegia hungarica]|uniref:Uncharacterized protein n=1 Tax=Dioszegia hungarica TaxID=4972 RepID=A0AA38HDJ8_9TREE|nr:uncharacterized protein MKK02DRAFT_29259 [Dioszegia hungarica]KAI9639137.1 hypothetical protein MKK02DRAFT_29259 [Dioszegia hungarica]